MFNTMENTGYGSPEKTGLETYGPAGIMAGAGFLNSYLQAKAQEEAQRRQMLVDAEKQRAQGQSQGLGTLINVWRGALS